MQTLSLQSCTEPVFSISANLAFVDQIEADHRLIKSLVDWAENGVPSRVAKKIGVAASTINRHYKGDSATRLGRDTLAKLQTAYPDFPKWNSGNRTVLSEVAEFGDRPFEEKFGSGELSTIPVLGSAIGMSSFDPERHIELMEIDEGEVLDYIRRPLSLSGDKDAYALTVVGDSMWPRFRPGRRVIVSPRASVSIGDDVIVQLKGSEAQTALNRDAVTAVLIKELVRRSASYIELRQFNPHETFQVPMNQVATIHRVIGEVY